MVIQDLQYIENVDCANEIKGSGIFDFWASNGGNLATAGAESSVLGTRTYGESLATVDLIQGIGSTSKSMAWGWGG